MFDILPLYGTLQPGDTEQVTFTFYGHADIWGEVKAVCEVEGGPTYELKMTGEASLVEYEFNTKEIDYGKQVLLLFYLLNKLSICCLNHVFKVRVCLMLLSYRISH